MKTSSYSLLLVVALVACDGIYGVRRDAALATSPSRACVRHVIETEPGLRVEKESDASGPPDASARRDSGADAGYIF